MSRRQLRWSGALFTALLCTGMWLVTSAESSAVTTRRYYVAAEEVVWDYAPSGKDEISGQPFDAISRPFMEAGPRTIGRKYLKALYREYTDSTFTTLKPRPPQWEHLGFLGPLIRAEVGDTIRVVFRNKTRHPASMHPHGVFYNKDSEGAPYADRSGAAEKKDDGVPTGGTHTYVWPVPERAGPGRGDPASVFWMYHSHVDEPKDANSGLIGPMIITRAGRGKPDGVPKDVDREFINMFMIYDENQS